MNEKPALIIHLMLRGLARALKFILKHINWCATTKLSVEYLLSYVCPVCSKAGTDKRISITAGNTLLAFALKRQIVLSYRKRKHIQTA